MKKILKEGITPHKQPYGRDQPAEAFVTFQPGAAMIHAAMGSEKEYVKRKDPSFKEGTGKVIKVTMPKSEFSVRGNKSINDWDEALTHPGLVYQIPVTKKIEPRYLSVMDPKSLTHKAEAWKFRTNRAIDRKYPE